MSERKNKKTYRIITSIILSVAVIIFFMTAVMSADRSETIRVHRNQVTLQSGSTPVTIDNFLYDGTTYVPVRAIVNLLGKRIDWHHESKKIIIGEADMIIQPHEDLYLSLYFPDKNAKKVWQEQRSVPVYGGNYAEAAILALIEGPVSPNLSGSLPKGTKVLGTNILNGICTVNFSAEFVDNHSGGSAGEQITLASVVNTLVSFDSIQKVMILVEGKAGATLGNVLLDHAIGGMQDIMGEYEDGHIVTGFDFSRSSHGWVGDFTDLPVDYEEDIYELDFSHTYLPAPLDTSSKALMLSGHNRSDDLFMYVKKQLGQEIGIKPDTDYLLHFTVEFATDAPAGAVGIGGPPGEAVWIKVGAVNFEPVPISNEDPDYPYYILNADKGWQNDDGEHALRIGDAAKVYNDEFYVYELKTLNNINEPLEARSGPDGSLWVFVGTDSGFEGKTTLYYTKIAIEIIEK